MSVVDIHRETPRLTRLDAPPRHHRDPSGRPLVARARLERLALPGEDESLDAYRPERGR